MKHFILATAGHVDHGKSALVKALTGTDPDRLPEEKARGMTIELGFAQLEFKTAGASMNIGIVDVPGHEDFIKNMVAGVGSIDLALLVVAADDGWMPQTEEHLQILCYLGVRRAVVALTKIDLAKSEDAAESDVRAQLAETVFHDAPIVRTSITAGRGIGELKAQLACEFGSLAPQADIGKTRLSVDRAFTLRGIGTIVTGTLTGGTFRRADAVAVQPANIPARIRAIQSHNREVEEIGPGARTALNLADVAVARERGQCGVWRGDVITLADFGTASAVIDAALTRSARLPITTRAVKHGAAVRVHHGSGNSAARIFFQSGEKLRVRETGIAQLRFDAPVFMFAGDRFVVRDVSEQCTLAGGVVLDPDASVKNFTSAAAREFLNRRMSSPEDAAVFVSTQLVRDRAARRPELLVKSRFSRAEISAAISKLTESGIAVELGDLVLDAKSWAGFCGRAISQIEDEHRAHPNRVGLELTRLRSVLGSEMPLPEVFNTLISELCKNGFVHSGETIQRATHRPTLPPSLQSAGARINAALATKPFDPPSRKELAPDAISQQTLRFLCDTGEVVEINDDVVLGSEEFATMRDAVIKFIRARGSASVSELRQTLGSSRRVIVPFLERLDREGVTRRAREINAPFVRSHSASLAQRGRAASIRHSDSAATKLEKLEALLSATDNLSDSTRSLFADLLSIPLDDRYYRAARILVAADGPGSCHIARPEPPQQMNTRQLIPLWLKLDESVRTGEPAEAYNEEHAGTEFFTELVENIIPMSYGSAQARADHLKLADATQPARVLDLAAGSGIWGIVLAQKSPHVRVTAVDWVGMIPTTRRITQKFGVADQFEFVETTTERRTNAGATKLLLLVFVELGFNSRLDFFVERRVVP